MLGGNGALSQGWWYVWAYERHVTDASSFWNHSVYRCLGRCCISKREVTRRLILSARPCISFLPSPRGTCMHGPGHDSFPFLRNMYRWQKSCGLFVWGGTHPLRYRCLVVGFCLLSNRDAWSVQALSFVLAPSRAWIRVPDILMGLGKMPLGSSGGERAVIKLSLWNGGLYWACHKVRLYMYIRGVWLHGVLCSLVRH